MSQINLAFELALLIASTAPAMAELARPAISDPSSAISPPASMAEIAFNIHGSRTNGLVYLAAGPGPHPLVIFLHGFPGNEKNLDLAQAVRRAGYHAIYAEYRGAWGSGGNFSFTHGLEDVGSIIEGAREPANAEKYRMDSSRIALVGHSYGGNGYQLAEFGLCGQPGSGSAN